MKIFLKSFVDIKNYNCGKGNAINLLIDVGENNTSIRALTLGKN